MKKIITLLVCLLFVTLQAQEIKPIQDSLQTPEQPVIKELTKEEVAALKTQLPKSNIAPQEPMARLATSSINPSTPTVATGTSNEVGVTAGSLSVSLTGGAVYNMPIYAPPGINGVEPKISLQYNSQSGNGMAGWGWNVTGVSSISRVPATMHHDGRVGGVNLNMQDRFALDGQRLLLKDPTQTYGAPGTEYVTENYSNLRIIASSTPHPLGTQYGPASFTVYYPDGSVATYGEEVSGPFFLILPSSIKKTQWGLSKFEDARNLRIDYEYVITPLFSFWPTYTGDLLKFKRILYGHKAGGTPLNIINFEYNIRNRGEIYYVGGESIGENALLSYIEIFGSGQKLIQYQLSHNVTNLNYNLLSSVTEMVWEGNTVKQRNPTVFEYGDNLGIHDLTIRKTTVNNEAYQNNTHKVITGDFNGSGNQQVIIYPSTGSGTSQNITYYNDFIEGQNNGINTSLPHSFEDAFAANGLNSQDKMLPKSLLGVVNTPTGDDKTYFRLYEFNNNNFSVVGNIKSFNFPRIEIDNPCPLITLHCGLEPADSGTIENRNTSESSNRDIRNNIGYIKEIYPIDYIPIPSCANPTNITFLETNLNEYTLSWTHDPNEPNPHYEVFIMEVIEGNYPPNQYSPIGQAITVYDTFYIASNINPSKQYRFYVRKICNNLLNLEASSWVGPYSNLVYKTFTNIKKKYINGDFNGDGITDIIAIEEPTPYFTKNCDLQNNCYTQNYLTYINHNNNTYFINLDNRLNNNNFVNLAGKIHTSDKIEVGDYNGNGKSDLFVFNNGRVRVYELNEFNQLILIVDFSNPKINTQKIVSNRMNLFTWRAQWGDSLHIVMGDFNGDGKTDFIVPKKETEGIWTSFYSNGGSSFAFEEKYYLDYYDSYPQHMYHDKYVLHEFFYIPVDINNDGKTDLFRINNISVLNHTGFYNYPGISYNGVPLETRICSSIGSYNYSCLQFNLSQSQFDILLAANHSGNNRSHLALHRHPIPLFLNHNNPYKQGELSFISHGRIVSYNTHHNNQVATSLKKITLGNGVEEGITYSNLMPSNSTQDPIYQAANLDHAYPYYCLSAAPSFVVVSQLERKSATSNHHIKQKYRYFGAISRVDGLGFQGFQATTSTNWYNETDPKIFTNHKKYDATKRGALLEDVTIWEQMHPNPTNSFNPFVSKSVMEYQDFLSPTKVYTIRNHKQTAYDGLLNTSKTTETILYDAYNSPRTVVEKLYNNSVQEKEVTNIITYDNNPNSTSNYYIGRLTKKETTRNNFTAPLLSVKEEYDYNAEALVFEVRKWGHNTNLVKENNIFDTYGNIIQKTITAGGIGRTTSFKYDPTNRFVEESTDVEGLKTLYTYYNPTGLLKTETTPYGATTTYEYDSWGKKTRIKDYLNNFNIVTYTPINNRRFTQINTTLADGSISNEFTDDLGRKYRENSNNVSGTFINVFTEFNYLNQVVRKSEPTAAVTGQQWTNFEYDIYGRANKVTMPSGRVATTQYIGLTTVVNDGVLTTTVVKNALGLEVSKQDPTSGTLLFAYDANDKLKSTNYGGHIVTIDYDGWGRKKELRDPTISTTTPYTYSYNDFGEILTETTPNGTTTYNYNTSTGKLNNKTVVGSNTNSTSTYNYDNTTKLLLGMTHLDSSNSRTTIYSYEYEPTEPNKYKRLIKTTETTPEAKFEKTLSYDNLGRNHQELIKATHTATGKSAERTVRTNYQNGDYKSLLAIGGGNTVVLHNLLTVNDRNQLLTATYGNGLNQLNQYSNLGFLQFANTRNASNALLVGLNTTFDAQRGNLTSRSNNLFTNTSETFTYDNLDRLTHFPRYKNNGTWRKDSQQEYDNYGRINKNVVGTYDYNTPGKRYQNNNIKINNNDNQYLNLNTRNQDVTYYVNKSPKTIEVKHQNGTTLHDRLTFYNNGIDSRSRVDFQMSNRKKYYSADGSAEITQLASGQVEIVLFLGGDAYTAPAVLHKNASNQENLLYLHRDYLGSIVAITNQAGAVVERRHFDAWGQLTHFGIGTGTSTTTLPNGITSFLLLDRGYTGHEHLLSVGLVHMNGRLYDPVLHRFLQPDNNIQDPLNSQNYNRYGYAWNNPLRYSDPSGEIVWAAVLVGAIIGAAAGAAGYIATAIQTGNWNWGHFGLSILGGAVIGGLSGGLNPKSVFSANIGASMATAFVGGFMPAHGVQIGDWSISISPSIAFGISFGAGFNVGVSYTDGDWSFSGGIGVMSYGNYNGFGKNSSQVRYSILANYDDGKTGFSVGNNFYRGDFQQRTAYLGIRKGDFSLGYENDGSPFSYAGKALSNNTDMYRTAAAYIGIGDYEMQLNMFTGRSGNDIGQGRDNDKNPDFVDLKEGRTHKTKGILGLWSNPEANMYRLGSLTLGYKGFRVGLNSEHIRDGFQNWFAHKVISPQPGFRMLSNGWSGYMQYQTPYKHRSTLW